MAERAVRAVKRPQHPSNAYLLQQQRRAARDVPLCVPQLRLAWAAFGIGLASVLLSLCLMIGGAASSSMPIPGAKVSNNFTIVYVGIVFLIIGLVSLVLFGVRFARVRKAQKSEYIGRDSGHDNAAFPASDTAQEIPMTPKPSKYTNLALPDSPNDSAYSSLALPSNPGSELSARRLQQTNSRSAQYSQPNQCPLPPNAGQYHRVNSQDSRSLSSRPDGSQSSTTNPVSASTVVRSDGGKSRSQWTQPSAYYPARPMGQPSPSIPPQARQGYPQRPTSSTNRTQMYTNRLNSRSMEQPTSQPRSGGPQTSARNTGPSVRLNSSSTAVSDAARHLRGPPPVARNHGPAVVPVSQYPPPIQEYDPSFHASTSSVTVHDPYRSHHINSSRGAGAYDSPSSGTMI